ncbi:branched-chain amino acid ABC transporter substrate-binding protein [Burkholderia cepacia]|uniref:branched-chain amino acid ABC transporter substrate-binding protein n=1 Tax=Burkholderia cepacia TaxID=292 RepID=UPI000F5A339A|nr:branched-chain amino acid ABC transporter substrate-binding protein [Burkholderia cepacia]RQU90594.1 branched-chain amino acid ABC transporter substrate-binding protein [Burkholderia cenocepacia]RQV30340.1 branched-chain amino acid ABC transporter substrate-binding protein [Burkholderia cenocepacia]RQV88830.1 branched-chain amino acid ABC transporter substrate-binding protein [Burkholderia cenocepacia]RQZ91059.1 branched-chain amino acid ABC transporter substrate-binding protein [Burkholderi
MIIKMQRLLPITATTMLCAAAVTNAAADQVVKIGHVGPLTGGTAHIGKDNENGARLAIEEINAKGLMIGGQKIRLELDAQDDAADPRQATQVAQKLVDDKVVAVVGHQASGTSIPASKIYSDAGIVQITPSATNPAYTQQGFKTTFRVVATDAQQGPALASFAHSKGIKTVAVVDDSTAFGQGLANEFEKKAKVLGLKVLSHDATNDKAIDFRAILTKIKGENPDAIMYGGMDATGGPLAKQAKQLGLRAKIYSGDGVCTEKLADLAGDATNNVVCSEAGAALEKMPGGAAFQAKYEKRYGHPIEIYAPFTYDAVYIVVDAMKRSNSTAPAKILGEMPTTNYTGVIGTTTFDSKGDLQHGVISLYTYKGGKKTFVDEVKM